MICVGVVMKGVLILSMSRVIRVRYLTHIFHVMSYYVVFHSEQV